MTDWQSKVVAQPEVLETQRAYQDRLSAEYRRSDEEVVKTDDFRMFEQRLRQAEGRFPAPIAALEIGCGTGRYFACFRNTRRLVGVDLSADMLAQARHPVRESEVRVAEIRLVQGNVLDPAFRLDETFDLVYSIGVLAEHAPLTRSLARRVAAWLRPNGLFVFTAVPRGFKRAYWFTRWAGGAVAVAPRLLRWLPAAGRARVIRRLGVSGFAADEAGIRGCMQGGGLIVEALEPILRGTYPHFWVVARREG